MPRPASGERLPGPAGDHSAGQLSVSPLRHALVAQRHGRGRGSGAAHRLSHRGALLDGLDGTGVAKSVAGPTTDWSPDR